MLWGNREDKEGELVKAEKVRADLTRVLNDAWLEGHLHALDEIYAADFTYHSAPFPHTVRLQSSKQDITGSRAAFPDIRWTTHEMIMEGRDTLVTQYTLPMTHTGESPTIPLRPTGKQVIYAGCMVSHFAGGKIIEEWNYGDYLGVLQQHAQVPSMEAEDHE